MTTVSIPNPLEARRELATLTIVSIVHLVSHFYWLLFVPLLPSLRDLLQVSYVELGFALFLMNVVSALVQAPTGFWVDRLGPRLFLVIGVALGAAGFVLLGVAPSYPVLLVSAVLVGLGNAVYHPADYSILSAEMSQARMGRAFSLHTFAGYLGFALAPPVMLGLVYTLGPRMALVAGGLTGVVLSLPLLAGLPGERRALARRAAAPPKPKTATRSLFTPAVLALTAMFTFINLSTNMLQTYMVVSFETLFGLPQSVGETALTFFMFTIVGGVLAGGLLADNVKSKGLVTLGGFGAAALVILFIGSVNSDGAIKVALIALAGFLAGLIMPSRDMLVRMASPPDSVGSVFGIVSTGFNIGGMIGPLLGGWFIDDDMPRLIYFGSALFMAATVAIAVMVERASKR